MHTKSRHTIVIMPNNKRLEVSYYCSDLKLRDQDKNDYTDLIIQLHDCHTSFKISKAKSKDPNDVETLVQKTVINARGHLCD